MSSYSAKGIFKGPFKSLRLAGLAALLALAPGCRQDMHDQPRYEPLEPSTFFEDGRGSRPPVEGTVARGSLREDSEFFTGRAGGNGRAGGAAQGQQPSNIGTTETGTTSVSGTGAGGTGATRGTTMTGGAALTNQGAAQSSDVFAQYEGFVTAFPYPVTKEVLDRGEERYNIFCSVCHSRTGDGNGMVVRRGYRKPPSFHEDRLRQAPVGYYFDVITNGFGAMPDYSAQITARDRWAIIAYLRALQRSFQGTPADVPPDQRDRLNSAGQGQEGRQQ